MKTWAQIKEDLRLMKITLIFLAIALGIPVILIALVCFGFYMMCTLPISLLAVSFIAGLIPQFIQRNK